VEPFLRGCPWPPGGGATYPRADPADAARLPADTWAAACVPASVRLEFVGSAAAVEIAYLTATTDFGYRGPSAGHTFALWQGDEKVDEAEAELGEGRVRLHLGSASRPHRWVVHLPEGMRPTVLSIAAIQGEIEPPPPQPLWVAYGDSILEGWIASEPARGWASVAARRFGLDVVNMGYAGAARGEIVSAEHLASLPAAVISVTHGTNCWTRVPHSTGQMRENLEAFLTIVRRAHPVTPVVVASPVVRPDAEDTPNALGATLDDLRGAMEDVVRERMRAGDRHLHLIEGRGLLSPQHLPDGIHPGDEGHAVLADVVGGAVERALRTVD
jgi:lysophospholipase L1-like esterase